MAQESGAPPPTTLLNSSSNKNPFTSLNTEPIKNLDDLGTLAESHFNWFPQTELALGIKRQRNLLQKLQSWMSDIVDVEVTPLTIISQRFQNFVYLSLVGEDGPAEGALAELGQLIEDLKANFSQEQYEMFKYLLATEKAVGRYLLGDIEGARGGLEEMKKIYGDFISTDKAKAVALGLKGLMLGHIGRTSERLECFLEAIKLDATSSDLHQYLYSTYRRLRREREFGATPSEEELRACVKGYELLELKTSSALFRMATMCEDLLSVPHGIPEVAKILMEGLTRDVLKKTMLWFLEQAVELNPKSVSVQCKYGDILAKSSIRDDDKCEKHFKICLELWPNHSQVLHKAGKFYAVNRGNVPYGLELLTRGLQADKDNFPCLMEYLRCLSRQPTTRNWNSILGIITENIQQFRHKIEYKRKLLHAKGALLWSTTEGNEEEALECWIQAAVDALEQGDPTEKERDFLGALSGQSLFRRQIDFYRVLTKLEEVKKKETDADRKKIIEQLYGDIKTAVELDPPPLRRPQQQQRRGGDGSGRQFGHTQNQNYYGRQTNYEFKNNYDHHHHYNKYSSDVDPAEIVRARIPAIADQDSNWRSRSAADSLVSGAMAGAMGGLSLIMTEYSGNGNKSEVSQEKTIPGFYSSSSYQQHGNNAPAPAPPGHGRGSVRCGRQFGDVRFPDEFDGPGGEDQVDLPLKPKPEAERRVRGRGNVHYNPANPNPTDQDGEQEQQQKVTTGGASRGNQQQHHGYAYAQFGNKQRAAEFGGAHGRGGGGRNPDYNKMQTSGGGGGAWVHDKFQKSDGRGGKK